MEIETIPAEIREDEKTNQLSQISQNLLLLKTLRQKEIRKRNEPKAKCMRFVADYLCPGVLIVSETVIKWHFARWPSCTSVSSTGWHDCAI